MNDYSATLRRIADHQLQKAGGCIIEHTKLVQ